MNLGSGQTAKNSMAAPSSSTASWKPRNAVSDQFPAGLRVLVVDDDPTCLRILEKMLMNCLYEVTKCNRAEIALDLLRDNTKGYDIVISDVHMPDMDGFKLLEQVGLEMDLPVIMMSADDSKNVVMKGVTHGACDYMIKPVRIEALKNIWQHVVRKWKHEWKDKDFEQSGSVEEGERHVKPAAEDVDYSSSANEGNWKISKKRKEEEEEPEDKDDTSSLKKPRVVWSVELHQQFVAAVNQLGIEKAVPKKILELINVHGLTRENVASHLQKYRLYLRRLSGVSPHPNGHSLIGTPEAAFGSMPHQVYAATGQIPAQSLASLQVLGRPTPKTLPVADQRNIFSFENPKLRSGNGQQQSSDNNEQLHLLHGIPTNMEPKQFLNQSAQLFGGINMQVNPQASQKNSFHAMPRAHMLNDNKAVHIPKLHCSVGQSLLSNGLPGGVSPRTDNLYGSVYSPVSQPSLLDDFSGNNNDMHVNCFGHARNSGISSLPTKGVFQDDVNSEVKGSRDYLGYNVFSELQKHKAQDWGLPNGGSTFDALESHSDFQGSLDVLPSTVIQPEFCSQKNRNARVGDDILSSVEGAHVDIANFNPQINPVVDSSTRVKLERLSELPSCKGNLFQQPFSHDDLMNALLKQQGGIGVENEFGFDGYHMDNLPV